MARIISPLCRADTSAVVLLGRLARGYFSSSSFTSSSSKNFSSSPILRLVLWWGSFFEVVIVSKKTKCLLSFPQRRALFYPNHRSQNARSRDATASTRPNLSTWTCCTTQKRNTSTTTSKSRTRSNSRSRPSSSEGTRKMMMMDTWQKKKRTIFESSAKTRR